VTDQSKHYFRLKGQKAEDVIHTLAVRTFLTDWCYPNPRRPDGKELCDLLVVFDDVAIIWQIKDLKLDDRGRYNPSEVDKNLRQLSGARRQLFDLKTRVELENPRRGKELFDPSAIQRIFLVSVLMGEGEEYYHPFIQTYKERAVHVLSRDFAPIVMSELDTVSDFVRYLSAKEELLERGAKVTVIGEEEELLAYFVLHDHSFQGFENADRIVVAQGLWEEVQKLPAYIAKAHADEISYGWDLIIDRAHEGSAEYERIARELARPDRFKRRRLAKAFFDCQVRAHEGDPRKVYRRVTPLDDVTYCFLFFDDPEPWTRRKEMLQNMCYIARNIFRDNPKVLGIATERTLAPVCSYDFCFMDFPDWTGEHAKQAEELQRATGILTNVSWCHVTEDEFPDLDTDGDDRVDGCQPN